MGKAGTGEVEAIRRALLEVAAAVYSAPPASSAASPTATAQVSGGHWQGETGTASHLPPISQAQGPPRAPPPDAIRELQQQLRQTAPGAQQQQREQQEGGEGGGGGSGGLAAVRAELRRVSAEVERLRGGALRAGSPPPPSLSPPGAYGSSSSSSAPASSSRGPLRRRRSDPAAPPAAQVPVRGLSQSPTASASAVAAHGRRGLSRGLGSHLRAFYGGGVAVGGEGEGEAASGISPPQLRANPRSPPHGASPPAPAPLPPATTSSRGGGSGCRAEASSPAAAAAAAAAASNEEESAAASSATTLALIEARVDSLAAGLARLTGEVAGKAGWQAAAAAEAAAARSSARMDVLAQTLAVAVADVEALQQQARGAAAAQPFPPSPPASGSSPLPAQATAAAASAPSAVAHHRPPLPPPPPASAAAVAAAAPSASAAAAAVPPLVVAGRWVWKARLLDDETRTVRWDAEAANSAPDALQWGGGGAATPHVITAVRAGLYALGLGFFASPPPALTLLVNGSPALSVASPPHRALPPHAPPADGEGDDEPSVAAVALGGGGVVVHAGHPSGAVAAGVSLTHFLALPAHARVAVLYHGQSRGQGFIELRKL